VIGDEHLKSHITTYYKNLFGQPKNCDISLREDQNQDIPQISPEENDILVSPFTESEVREAVF